MIKGTIGPPVCLFAGLLAFAGCGRYSDFTLPVLSGGDPSQTFWLNEYPEPVLERGEAHDALNPSVAGRDMFYSAWDGHTWRTVHARTDDGGMHWQKLGVVLAPDPNTWEGSYIAANGTVLADGAGFRYWYVAGPRERPRIGLARSANGVSWRKEPQPVLEPGPYMSWDEYGVADPYVIRAGSALYMYYLGQDRGWRQRIGVARSADGIHWRKLSNPVLDLGDAGAFDENGVGEPAVWTSDGFYWMLYTGRGAGEIRRLGLARSTDGVHWRKMPAIFSGGQAWDSKVMCDPHVDGDHLWFGGGDVARPDENLNGQIGFGMLLKVHGTVGK